MKIKDLIIMSLRNLKRRKVRTFLAILSVVIGSSAIVLMLSLGFGLKKSFKEMLATTGDLSVIKIMPSYESRGFVPKTGGANRDEKLLDDNLISKLKTWKDVSNITAVIQDDGAVVTGKKLLYAQVKAINPEDMVNMGLKSEEGRLLKEGDENCIVLGSEAARQFQDMSAISSGVWNPNQDKAVDINKPFIFTFDQGIGMNDDSPFESDNNYSVKLPEYKVKVVGILKESQDWEVNYSTFMPIKSLEKYRKEKDNLRKSAGIEGNYGDSMRERNKNKYSYISLKVTNPDKVADINTKIKEMGFDTQSSIDTLQDFNEFAGVIQMVLGGIGAISMVVAAIGIANTMIMSIYERTKEIGVMKVIGASVRDIRNLFLMESAFIGGFGGLTGGFLSLGLSSVLSNVLANSSIGTAFSFTGEKMTQLSYVPWWLIVASILGTAVVGVISGYLPARKATKLSALDAIRTN